MKGDVSRTERFLISGGHQEATLLAFKVLKEPDIVVTRTSSFEISPKVSDFVFSVKNRGALGQRSGVEGNTNMEKSPSLSAIVMYLLLGGVWSKAHDCYTENAPARNIQLQEQRV